MKLLEGVKAVFLFSGVQAVFGLQPIGIIADVARDVERVESVREIKDVQRTFAQMAQFGRWNDMAGLFSTNGTVRIGLGNLVPSGKTTSLIGRKAIADWLETDSGSMNGITPGSLSILLNEDGLVTLSPDGRSAKARWNCMRFMGDGAGTTRIEGGIYENEYALSEVAEQKLRWEISLLRYYPMYEGNYSKGWQNTGKGSRTLPIIPYHFTPDDAGIPIQLPATNLNVSVVLSNISTSELDALAYRIQRLNDEDEVRNLQHSYGYYVDRRMWPDVVDLFVSNATINFGGLSYTGVSNIRQGLEQSMGPEGLIQGILNDHLIFDTIVEVDSNGREAITRGIEIGMLGDANKEAGFWKFGVFRNHFIKDADTGIWKIKAIETSELLTANYSTGWGYGSVNSTLSTARPTPLEFLQISSRSSRSRPKSWRSHWLARSRSTVDTIAELQRGVARSAAVDETENVSAAYGYYADDIRCSYFAALHAQKGFKESPFVGWYWSPQRIDEACQARYHAVDPNPLRPSVPFHWRLQPVIHASQDGRSTSLRTRLLQFGTSNSSTPGFNIGMYHDQLVLEDFGNGTTRRKLWSLTLDEFYAQSGSWTSGWAAAKPQNGSSILRRQGIDGYLPDVALTDPKLGEREVGLIGGSGQTVVWPGIQRVWWSIRNAVSGRVPQWYWAPGCVPCREARPDWALAVNGYQEPPTGPSLVSATVNGTAVTVKVAAGPEEQVSGTVELWRDGFNGTTLLRSAPLDKTGGATFAVPASGLSVGANKLTLLYTGSDQLKAGRTSITVQGQSLMPLVSPRRRL